MKCLHNGRTPHSTLPAPSLVSSGGQRGVGTEVTRCSDVTRVVNTSSVQRTVALVTQSRESSGVLTVGILVAGSSRRPSSAMVQLTDRPRSPSLPSFPRTEPPFLPPSVDLSPHLLLLHAQVEKTLISKVRTAQHSEVGSTEFGCNHSNIF